MNYFTADSHFSFKEDLIIFREFRPFNTLLEMNEKIIDIWNSQAKKDDTIYCLGDFINYNWNDMDYDKTFKLVQKINAKVILILGNNEERVLNNDFDNNFEKFKSYLLSVGFFDVIEHNAKIEIGGNEYFLTHKPVDCIKESEYNLFGHIHKSVFIKRYGFNVGVDNHYFRLFSEEDILELQTRRSLFDENVYD